MIPLWLGITAVASPGLLAGVTAGVVRVQKRLEEEHEVSTPLFLFSGIWLALVFVLSPLMGA